MHRHALLILGLLLGLFAGVASAAPTQDTSLEEFPPVDPHTKGQSDLMQRLGVVSFGPFLWAGAHNSMEVKSALGGTPVIFIETEHFRFASTLESYKYGEDRIDKKWIDDELAAFKKKLPKFKAPAKIDPWLRAHLWAQRLEAQYEDFVTRFELTPQDFSDLERRAKGGEPMGEGPYLGQKNKFTVLLTQTRSALGRYLKQFTGLENEFSYRYKFEDSYFFGANFEALKDGERAFEISFATSVAAALTMNFVDGMRDSGHVAPDWFAYGLSHWYARRVDARWNQWGAGGDASTEDDSWVWEPRVLGLVKNDAALPWEGMLGWKSAEDIKPREHMLAWSRVDFLLERKADKARDLLLALTKPIDKYGPERDALRQSQGLRALEGVLGADLATLDEEWRAWVLKAYTKKR